MTTEIESGNMILMSQQKRYFRGHAVTVFNSSMANLGEVAGKSVEQLSYQLESWDDSSDLRFYAKPNRHAN